MLQKDVKVQKQVQKNSKRIKQDEKQTHTKKYQGKKTN